MKASRTTARRFKDRSLIKPQVAVGVLGPVVDVLRAKFAQLGRELLAGADVVVEGFEVGEEFSGLGVFTGKTKLANSPVLGSLAGNRTVNLEIKVLRVCRRKRGTREPCRCPGQFDQHVGRKRVLRRP